MRTGELLSVRPAVLKPANTFSLFPLLILDLVCLSGCQSAQAIGPTDAQLTPVPLTSSAGADSIHLASGDWAPYAGKDLPGQGCDSQVITEAFALEGIRVEYAFFPWARSLSLAQEGTLDGTLEWADTPGHREKFYLSADYLSNQEWVFFYQVERPFDWHSLDDLAGLKVGVTSGYVYSNAFEEIRAKGSVTFEEASSDEANFRKLLAGRIDVFPMEEHVGRAILKQIFTSEERARIGDHPRVINAFHPYLLLSKAIPENQKRIELFDRGWRQLQQSGRYTEIMQACANSN
jgi:polar amino acid transport system substrate-binding protein